MHRAPLLKLLSEYSLRFPDEEAVTRRFLEFVKSNSDCFERSLTIGHITGSAWIIDAAGDAVLLTHHRKLDIWVQPGGHADGETDILSVALKEADEETGLDPLIPIGTGIFDLDIHEIPARKSEAAHLHYDVRFALRHSGKGNYIVSDESHDLAWVPFKNLNNFTTEESIHRMAMKSP